MSTRGNSIADGGPSKDAARGRSLKSSLLLLLASAIWGFAFVAQREGARYVGAFAFNGIRFALGAISLLPVMWLLRNRGDAERNRKGSAKITLISGGITGLVLFVAASLQQIGIETTDAGKAAFITGLYIPLVPIFGLVIGHRTTLVTWIGAATAFLGLYLLSVTSGFSIGRGDILLMIGAVFWTVHILLIDRFSKKIDAIKLSLVQFTTCSFLCLIVALMTESLTIAALTAAAIPLLYGGVCSVGIAYTLQVIGQRNLKPSHTAIILSMESVFAALGGILILNETMSLRGYVGAALMLTGIVLSQLERLGRRRKLLKQGQQA